MKANRQRFVTFASPMPLPNIGEIVHNPAAGEPDEALSAYLKDRSFSYRGGEVTFFLKLTKGR